MNAARTSERRRDALAMGAVLLLGLVLFAPFLNPATAALPGPADADGRTQWACWRDFAAREVRAGRLPLWNPYVLCGTPFLAGGQSGLFYPPNALFLALPLTWAARLSLLLHFLAAGAFTWLLARYLGLNRLGAVAAAAVFMLGAPQLLRLYGGHWGAACVIAWMPLVLLATEALLRRPTAAPVMLGGVAVAMQLLAGAPQYAAYTAIAAGLYLLLRLATGRHRTGETPVLPEGEPNAAADFGLSRVAQPARDGGTVQERPGASPCGNGTGETPVLPEDEASLQARDRRDACPAQTGNDGTAAVNSTFDIQHSTLPLNPTSDIPNPKSHSTFDIRHSAFHFILMYLFGAVLGAVQLAPLLAAAPYAARAGGMLPAWTGMFALPPENLLTLLTFGLFGNGAGAPYWGRWNVWEMSAYVGAVAVLLALVGAIAGNRRWRGPAAIVAALLLLLALGRNLPPVYAVYRHLPFVGMLRSTSKFLAPCALLLALLAGLGVDAMPAWVRTAGGRRSYLLIAGVLGAVLVALLAISLSPGAWSAFVDSMLHQGERYATVDRARIVAEGARWARPGLIVALVSLAAAAACVLLARRDEMFARLTLTALIVLPLAVFAALYLNPRRSFTVDDPAAQRLAAVASTLGPRRSEGRVVLRGYPTPDDAMRFGLRTVEGIDPNPPLAFHQLFQAANQMPRNIAPSVYQALRPSPAWATMSLRHEIRTAATLLQGAPRARIAHRYRVVTDAADRLRATAAGDWLDGVILAAPPVALVREPSPQAPAESVTFATDQPNDVRLRCRSSAPGLLVLTDTFFPGWEATVDGLDTPILEADYAFRAVALPAGDHVVAFAYRPWWFAVGWRLSLAGVVLFAGWATMAWRRRKARG